MINASLQLVSKIYSRKDNFDTKLIDESITKTLATFYNINAKSGLLKMASQIDDRDLLYAIIFSIPELKLKSALTKEDGFWQADNVASEGIRDHLFQLAIGVIKPIPDSRGRAKALLPKLKNCKTIEDLKSLFSDGDSKEFIESSAKLLKPEKKLRAFVRRFDKNNAFIETDSPEGLIKHLVALASGQVDPFLDSQAQAKALLPQLKNCKKIEDLKNLSKDGYSKDMIEASAKLLKPEKTLRAFVRRFDKNNTMIETDAPQDLIKHLVALASGQVDPAQKAVKPLKSAAMKAKWSGKEPD